MGYCTGPNPEAGIEKAWLVEMWFDVATQTVTGTIILFTTFLLYRKC